MEDTDFGDVTSFPSPGRFTLGQVTRESFPELQASISDLLAGRFRGFLSTREAGEVLGYEGDKLDDLDSTVFGDLADAICDSYESFLNYIRDEDLMDEALLT